MDIRNNWKLDEVSAFFDLPFNDLIFKAQTIHRQNFDPNKVQISTLLSIKTGSCPEDCKYCPQSAHYNTNIEKQPLMKVDDIIKAALAAKENGASRFCMGIAWRNIHDRDLSSITDIIREVKKIDNLELCLTAGMVTESQACKLKEEGLDYYNHNIDTSDEFYDKIITTRNFQDRIETIDNIRKSGIKTCSGVIIGMGESMDDRAKMLMSLANMVEHPVSVPINFLVAIKGTPLENAEKVDVFDFVRMVAIARIMMPKSFIRLSAGRATMSDEMQALCFFSGANSIHYGKKLLTQNNNVMSDDHALLNKLGIKAA